jgi:hypothetical protein
VDQVVRTAVGSPGMSGQTTAGIRAPMLGSGRFPTSCRNPCLGESTLDQECPGSSPGGATRRPDTTSVGRAFRFYARCYRFSTAPAARRVHKLGRATPSPPAYGLVGVLVTRQQGRHVLPAAGRGHVLERQLLPLRCPLPPAGVPETTLELGDAGGRFGLAQIVLTLSWSPRSIPGGLLEDPAGRRNRLLLERVLEHGGALGRGATGVPDTQRSSQRGGRPPRPLSPAFLRVSPEQAERFVRGASSREPMWECRLATPRTTSTTEPKELRPACDSHLICREGRS